MRRSSKIEPSVTMLLPRLDVRSKQRCGLLLGTDFHLLAGEFPGLLLHEDIVLFSFQKHGLGGHAGAGIRRSADSR